MTNIKFYIGSALILLFLIGGFIIWNRYLNRLETNDNREYELSIGEQKRQAQNDSVKSVNDSLRTANKILVERNEQIEQQKGNARTIFINTVKEHTNLSANKQGELLIRKIKE